MHLDRVEEITEVKAVIGIGRTDSLFTAILYVSDADQIYRYNDEGVLLSQLEAGENLLTAMLLLQTGETYELCRWTVDLSALPSFFDNAASNPQGFYTE